MIKKNRNRITLGTFLGLACLSLYALITLHFSFQESCAQKEICSSITTPIVAMTFMSLLGTLAVSWIVHQVLWEMLYVKPLQYNDLIRISETSEAIK
ncbi:hypothetical protein [Roseibium album]|uniref:hypothetical protein n=1 Tax=Roseibium album TaxID=311410 RepID=UPI00131F3A19